MKGGRELRRPQSPASRQIDINENERRTSIVEKSQGLGAVWSGADLQPEGRQMPRKGHAEQGVLVDDKDAIIGVRAQQSPPERTLSLHKLQIKMCAIQNLGLFVLRSVQSLGQKGSLLSISSTFCQQERKRLVLFVGLAGTEGVERWAKPSPCVKPKVTA